MMLFFILWTRFSFDQISVHAFFFRLSIQLRSSCIGTYLWVNWIEASIAQEKNISSYTIFYYVGKDFRISIYSNPKDFD